MGQRLVFECKKDGKTFATLYYHWSGYTGSIYYEAWRLIEGLKDHGYYKGIDVNTIKKMLLDILQHYDDGTYHGGVDFSKAEDGSFPEFEAFKALGMEPMKDDVSRSEGLISITEKGIQSSIYYAEALEEFDFDTETFTNHEYSLVNSKYELAEYYEITDKELEEIPLFDDTYFGTVKWADAEAAWKHYNENTVRYYGSLGKNEDGGVYFATE